MNKEEVLTILKEQKQRELNSGLAAAEFYAYCVQEKIDEFLAGGVVEVKIESRYEPGFKNQTVFYSDGTTKNFCYSTD